MKIWIITDLHLGHKNMVSKYGRPEDYQFIIQENWREQVQVDDLVIVLGDLSFDQRITWKLGHYIRFLPGKKWLVIGNHDNKPREWYLQTEIGFDAVADYFIWGNIAFSHCPLTPLPRQANLTKHQSFPEEVNLNIHGHLHGTQPGEIPGYYDVPYYLKNKEKYFSLSIEKELRPFSLDEILDKWHKTKGGEKNEI